MLALQRVLVSLAYTARSRPGSVFSKEDILEDMTSSQEVTSNGGTHKVFLAGKKESPAVVLLHGFPTGAVMWERQVIRATDER